VDTDLKKLNQVHYELLSHCQAFTACKNDLDLICKGNKIGYCIDGYDLCRFILQPEFFIGRPNPHHYVMKSIWQGFFNYADGNVLFAVISPLAFIELLCTINDRINPSEVNAIIQKYPEIKNVIKRLADFTESFDSLKLSEQNIIYKLNAMLDASKNVMKNVIREGKFFNLNELISDNKLQTLDKIMKGNSEYINFDEFYKCDKYYCQRAIDYLEGKRTDKLIGYTGFYVKLDVYHYIMIENINAMVNEQNIAAFITSSGILARNAWYLAKYGKVPPNNLTEIPKSWRARPSSAPYYLCNILNYFNNNVNEANAYIEYIISVCKYNIHRLEQDEHLQKVLTLKSISKRRSLFSENPIIRMDDYTSSQIYNIMLELDRVLMAPSTVGLCEGNIQDVLPINYNELYFWITDKSKSESDYRKAREKIVESARELNLCPRSWKHYIAPIAKDAAEILQNYDPNIDI